MVTWDFPAPKLKSPPSNFDDSAIIWCIILTPQQQQPLPTFSNLKSLNYMCTYETLLVHNTCILYCVVWWIAESILILHAKEWPICAVMDGCG